jgi:hypothetical protein
MAGVLFWIGLTAGAASRDSDKVLRKWFAALAMRCAIVLCFEHQEPVHATLVKMGEFVEAAGFRNTEGLEVGFGESVTSGGGSGGGKRRRV